jgi:hypothetical protein
MPKPKKSENLFSQELFKILSKASKNKIYGSVEVFFEAGNITQITQRIINKLSSFKNKSTQKLNSKEINPQKNSPEKTPLTSRKSDDDDNSVSTRTP